MTPEEMENRIAELERVIAGLKNVAQLDPDIAFTMGEAIIASDSKSASSENQAVDEAGISTYSVLKPPDRWIKVGSRFIPAWDA